jgi:hypothetical protein
MFKRQRRRYMQFSFLWYFPPPQKGGVVGWGRAQQQQQKSTAAATATAARQGQTKYIHQRHGKGCVPMKFLYYESLTKSTKSYDVESLL